MFRYSLPYTLVCLPLKLFDKSENDHSAAAKDGWMRKTTLYALDQCGRWASCFFHKPSLSTYMLVCLKHIQKLPHTWESLVSTHAGLS